MDFLSKEQGVYEGMGVNYVVALKAALRTLFMVMNAGMAWTYTALDGKENILGGGISRG